MLMFSALFLSFLNNSIIFCFDYKNLTYEETRLEAFFNTLKDLKNIKAVNKFIKDHLDKIEKEYKEKEGKDAIFEDRHQRTKKFLKDALENEIKRRKSLKDKCVIL